MLTFGLVLLLVAPGFFEWTSTDRGGNRGGSDYDAKLAKYGEKLGVKYGTPLTKGEKDILRQHDKNDGNTGWDIFKLDTPTALRMGKKVFPVLRRLEKESPAVANRIKKKLRKQHGIDVEKMIKIYKALLKFNLTG